MKNFRMCAIPTGESLLLSYRLEPGVSEQSYGLFIARMAGMPETVLREAERLMKEKQKGKVEAFVEKLDVNSMTPVQALVCLNKVKEMISNKGCCV